MDSDRRGARRIALSHGRALVIRPIAPDDVDGVAALYEGLDREDRYRRFFSFFHPERSFFEALANVGARNGFGLVAVLTDDKNSGAEIVAECSYVVQENGDGDFEMTISRHWRGWLGGFLLATLAQEAADRGVEHLRADILATNGPMLAVARAHGWESSLIDRGVIRVRMRTRPLAQVASPQSGQPRANASEHPSSQSASA